LPVAVAIACVKLARLQFGIGAFRRVGLAVAALVRQQPLQLRRFVRQAEDVLAVRRQAVRQFQAGDRRQQRQLGAHHVQLRDRLFRIQPLHLDVGGGIGQPWIVRPALVRSQHLLVGGDAVFGAAQRDVLRSPLSGLRADMASYLAQKAGVGRAALPVRRAAG
jgi:hypothetical protein